ncbi:hypothetical protein [Actinoplanes regularis]|uniref:hypothetical protein n=1 Tax=Actinoplanes regularis TaxID=52697 RepID=UPI0024A5FDDD|nr:hypothetical protein [Actinoplanes regularis]GLW36044.1 hypothetical protein Areg01_89790 [Actinoplanes regularis]
MALRYLKTVLVAFSWYANIVLLCFLNSRLPYDDHDCDSAFMCLTALDSARLLFLVISWLLGASMVAALLLAVPVSRTIDSVLKAGTMTALGGIIAAVMLGLLWAFTLA